MSKINNLVHHLPLVLLLIISASLRITNLGYSDYQGDEIKSFLILEPNQTITNFLLDQRKGPGQFLVTFLVKLINPNYANEFITRLPFALAGIVAVGYFYALLKNLYSQKIAFYAAFLLATNGFFVAFARISQYQSFVILFMVLAIYMFSLASTSSAHKTRGILWGFLFWAFSLLFHYDAVFILPIVVYFLRKWLITHKVKPFDTNFSVLIKYALMSGLLLGLFYVPFVINLAQTTIVYWQGRISGEVSDKISSSRYLFTVYQPIYVIHIYSILTGFGLVYIISKLKRVKFLPAFDYDIKPTLFILGWFSIPFVFLEHFVFIPGTHIYTYLLPLFIIVAFGIVFLEKTLNFLRKYLFTGVISAICVVIVFGFIYLQSYAIFVENSKEYPWESEQFLMWELHQPTPIFHLSMFGFPYFRNWEQVSQLVNSTPNNGYYSTNERDSIARHYVPLSKSTDDAGFYVYIIDPQSFTNEINQAKAEYWIQRYTPIFTSSKGNKDLVRVYYMEPGTLEELQEKGY